MAYIIYEETVNGTDLSAEGRESLKFSSLIYGKVHSHFAFPPFPPFLYYTLFFTLLNFAVIGELSVLLVLSDNLLFYVTSLYLGYEGTRKSRI